MKCDSAPFTSAPEAQLCGDNEPESPDGTQHKWSPPWGVHPTVTLFLPYCAV